MTGFEIGGVIGHNGSMAPPGLRQVISPLLHTLNLLLMVWGSSRLAESRPVLPLLLIVMTGAFYVAIWLISKERWVEGSGNSELYRLQVERRRTMVRMSEALLLCINGGIVLSAWFSSLDTDKPGALTQVALVIMIALVPTLFFVPRIYRTQNAINEMTGSGSYPAGTDPQGWKAGIFYYAPDDPATIVPKRYGIGATFNFARLQAWVLLGLLLLPFIGVSIALSLR